MEAAIELAGTGHTQPISTLHANNAHQTMDRIINMFPQELHKQLFMDLSLNLRAIISQRPAVGKIWQVRGQWWKSCSTRLSSST